MDLVFLSTDTYSVVNAIEMDSLELPGVKTLADFLPGVKYVYIDPNPCLLKFAISC